eukprot:6484669-Alexandrium_andersonii.AAC.1
MTSAYPDSILTHAVQTAGHTARYNGTDVTIGKLLLDLNKACARKTHQVAAGVLTPTNNSKVAMKTGRET